jgi:hypothetical protein
MSLFSTSLSKADLNADATSVVLFLKVCKPAIDYSRYSGLQPKFPAMICRQILPLAPPRFL